MSQQTIDFAPRLTEAPTRIGLYYLVPEGRSDIEFLVRVRNIHTNILQAIILEHNTRDAMTYGNVHNIRVAEIKGTWWGPLQDLDR